MEVEESALFSISDQPEKIVNASHHVPAYHVDHVLDLDAEPGSEKQPKKQKFSRNCCWNCGGTGHALRQCPLPQDHRTINKNRAQFTAQRTEFKRYHVEAKVEKYPHLKPGQISDKLREALGLKDDQLPVHIYKMRTLGYPPGWLLEAKADSSGIEMFDMEGNRVPNADEEEGEIGASSMYDESKIISYPGFNEWPAPGIIDETSYYGVPELRCLPSREEFIKSLRQVAISSAENSRRMQNPDISAGECDMETEDIDLNSSVVSEDAREAFVPPLPDDPLPPPPPEEPEDGELKEDNSSQSTSLCEAENTTPQETVIEENLLSNLDNSTHGRVVSVELGTPVLKIHSPYSKLPPPEAFQKDISDVINFENLPDSTGAYEKLKDVLKGVRKKMSLIKETKLNTSV